MLVTTFKINDISHRQKDSNGYLIIKNNPIAKAGVFEYLESEVVVGGSSDKIVKVCRTFDDLVSKKDAFAKKPIILSHKWIGTDRNDVDGAVSDLVTENDPYLVADLIIYNPQLIKAIEDKKIVELSPGYECTFIEQEGVYNNEPYNYLQVLNNVNHIAVVNEGRSGKDLKILDFKNKGINMGKNIVFRKILDALKRIINDETPDELMAEIDRIKSIPDDEYEGGAEAKLEAIKELEAKLELVANDNQAKDKNVNDNIDKRELIREIMALGAKKPEDFAGGETEQIETISKLAEKLAYTKDKDSDNDKVKDIEPIPDTDDITIPVETLKELIDKVTDKKVSKYINKINDENKIIFDSYQAVKNVIGDFDYSGKDANDIYAFGYECITHEKLDKALDAKTAFLFASKNRVNTKKVIDTHTSNDKITFLSSMLDNIK